MRPGTKPLTVTAVDKDSPADKAGLHVGDKVVEVNGKAPRSFIDFIQQLLDAGDKAKIKLVVQGDNDKRTCSLQLEPEKSFFNTDLVRRKLGMTVQTLTPRLAESFGVTGAAGALISEVESGSPAAKAELQSGMVITAMDGQETHDVVELAKMLHAKSKGDRVKLNLVAPIQRGIFIRITSGTVELVVR